VRDEAALGIEEELLFVDADSFEVAPGFSRVVGEGDERVKPELFESFVELATPVLPDPPAVLAELRRARAALADRAAAHGLRPYAAGSHPTARGREQEIVPLERYLRMVERIGRPMWGQLVCGLHVHVSVARDELLTAFEWVVPWLPVLLALSANSPFAEGEDTGRRSVRAERLLLMPTGGTPPVLRSWDDWETATGGDSTRRHWDAWPRPEFGTLEVRVMDMQTDVRRTAGFAAIVQALVRAAEPVETYDRELYARRRDEASRLPPDPAEVEALAALVESHLDGDLAYVVLEGRPEAERQLEVGIADAARDVAARTLG
jgi:glutamate---cysteine ligase / carboxylate-amine ligase